MIKLQKLDLRFYGFSSFDHRAEIVTPIKQIGEKRKLFNDIRVWCWDNYGPSCEVDYIDDCYRDKSLMPNSIWTYGETKTPWSWRIDDRRMFIYLKDSSLTHFQLKWM